MKLNDRYIKATLAGIPYLLPYGQLIAAPAPATRLNDSGSLLWDGILEGDSREELLALLADRYHATERERAALAEDVDQYLHSLCRMGILLADTPESRGDDTPPLFYRIGPLVFSYRGPSLLYDRFFSAFSCEEEDFDQEVLILTGKPASIPYGAVLIHTEELTICDSGSSYCFFFAAPWGIREMHVKKDGSRAVLYRMPDPDDMHIEDLFHALRFAFLILAQQKELYVLHSASFLYRGRAFLVSGSSGTGKSTHSALWHDLYQTPLLNGDLNLLGIRDNIPYAYGLPWCGTSGICTPKDYPLGGIIFLKQAAIDQVQSLQPDEKVLHILQRMISPAWTKELLLRNLHFSEALAPLIFSCRLYCTKEPSAARTLKAVIDAL